MDIFQPFAAPLAGVTILLLLCVIWFRRPIPGSSSSSVGYPYSSSSARLAAYEEMWRKEESDLWSWLEDRVGMEGLALKKDEDAKKQKAEAKVRKRERQKVLGSRDVEARLREERMTEREMEDAIRVTQERLEVLKRVVERTKSEREGAAADGDDDDDGKESL